VTAVEGVVAVLVGSAALLTIRTQDPRCQAMVFSMFGSTLALLFVVLQAPDVALSVIAVGAVYPIMILITLRSVRAREPRGRGGSAAPRSAGTGR
jgi:energy-converting hydrogenase B subunit D